MPGHGLLFVIVIVDVGQCLFTIPVFTILPGADKGCLLLWSDVIFDDTFFLLMYLCC